MEASWWIRIGVLIFFVAFLFGRRLVGEVSSWFRVWKILSDIPGPCGTHPLLLCFVVFRNFTYNLSVADFGTSLFNFLNGYAGVFRENKMFKVYLGLTPFVIAYSHETMEAALTHTSNINKSFHYRLLHQWLGTGLLTSDKGKWKQRRKLLTPAFHFKILEDILPVMNKEAMTLMHKIQKKGSDKAVDIMGLVQLCTLDIICEAAMGVPINAQEDRESPYVKSVLETGKSLVYRAVAPWFWPDTLFYYCTPYGRNINQHIRYMHNFALKIIQDRKQSLLKQRGEISVAQQKRSFIDILLEFHLQDPSFTINDIRQEVDTFMFEGHDTTSVGVSFAIFLIGHHPQVQSKLYNEIKSVFGTDKTRDITMDDLKKLPHMDNVIKESQRLFPSVPIIGRIVDEDFYIEGKLIPKGSNLNLHIYELHRDPKIFPDPEKFDPDRFSPGNCQGRNPFAYVPFSAGSRNCIGQKFALMEEKTVIANLLRNFEFKSIDQRDEIELSAELVLRPKSGLRVQFLPRP